MPHVHLKEVHPSSATSRLRKALEDWGFAVHAGTGEGTVILVADRPDPRWVPEAGTDLLWWVREGSPEEVSHVLFHRPGWVLRQSGPLEAVREVLQSLQHRDLGNEGWLRQMLHLASLEELLRLVLVRVNQLACAEGGAIWTRRDEVFLQRAGEGFPEAPIPAEEAARLVRDGQAWLLGPAEQMGLLRLRAPKGDPGHFLGWIRDVEDLLLRAWHLEMSRELSFRDDLTVAHNRRCLEAEMPKILRDAAARNESVALLFMDVDNLKAINTQFGHPTGSKVLLMVAELAQRTIRNQDRLYRYGGDEFCILIPGATASGASRLGERLIQLLMDNPLRISELEIPVSVSIGIASYPLHADGAERLVECADRALLQAKAEGKGRAIIAR